MFSFKSLQQSVNTFFFEERPVEGIALFRIIWVGLLAAYFLFDMHNVTDFYGPHALFSMETVLQQFPYIHASLFQILNNSYETVYWLMLVYGISIFTSLIGFYTRSSLVVMLLCMVSFHQRNIWLLSSAELLVRVITIYLVCSPCGHALSVDSLLSRKYRWMKKPRTWAPWALRLIQIQLSVVYVWTVWHKLKGEDWSNGTALYYATRLEDMTNFPVPFLLDWLPFIQAMTWGTLLVELALGIMIWFKEFRRPVILIGIVFHLGIELMMSIPFFELFMIALIINFYTPEEHKAFVERIKSRMLSLGESLQRHPFKERLLATVKSEE
jgi:hypothetical protein